MRCPLCKSSKVKTTDSRDHGETNGTRRKKRCLACEYTWATVELHMDTMLYYDKLQHKVQEYEQMFNASKQGWSKVWTPSEDALLIELCDAGAKYKDIAFKLGRPYKGVEMRIIKLRKDGKL